MIVVRKKYYWQLLFKTFMVISKILHVSLQMEMVLVRTVSAETISQMLKLTKLQNRHIYFSYPHLCFLNISNC